jgi:hypothetical protein
LGSLPPQPNNCRVELFNANPGSPVLIGTQVQLHGRGNCDGGVRAVKFQINGVNRAEIAQPEQWETWRTNEFGVGTYNVCFWVAGGADGRWEAGTRSCMLFQVIAEAPQPTPEPGIIRTGNNDANNGCSISSFVLNPASHNYPQGTHVTLTGTSNCGSVRFEVRNVNTNQIWPKAEIGQPNQTETLKTEEFPIGPYEVCFVARSSGGWENADYNCYPAGIGMTYEGTPGGSNTSPTPNLPTNGCPSRASRLHTGDIAVVNTSELNIRNRPGIQQGIPIGAPMQHGAQLTIVGGSVCADGYLWWEIGYNGRSGWSAEVGPNGYLMVPNGTPLTNNPPSQITPTQTPPPTEPISQVTPTRRCFQGGGYNNVTDPNGNHNYVWFSVGTTYNGYPTWAIYPPPNNIYFSLVHHSMNSVPSNGIARVYFQFAVLPYWVLPGADTWLLCSR